MSFRQEAQSSKPQQQHEEATIVQKGKVTNEEREYSKEYKKIYGNGDGKKLTEIREPGGIGIFIGPGSAPRSKSETVITANQFLERLSCQSDAVVVGMVKNKMSHLSDDETFVYTRYDFAVKRIIKDNSDSLIENSRTIAVTRPGGFIKIDEQVIKFDDASYKPLESNKDYLLFLKFVPTVNGYVVATPEGDFVLERNTFKRLSTGGLLNDLKNDTDSEILLSMVQNAITANCSQYLSGGIKEDE